MARRPFPRGGIRTRLPVTIYRRSSDEFSPTEIEGLALWLDASSSDLYTTDAGPVVAVASPLDIAGCALWLDASDAASITASGGLVSQWNDKSGNARHATASGSLRPNSGGSQNGRTVMQFTGTQAMTITGNFLQSDNVTMFAVAMKNTDHYGGIISSAPTNPEDSPVLCFYLTTIAWLNRRVLVQQATGNSVYRIVSGQSVGTAQQGFFDGVRGTDTTASVATNTTNTITKIGALRTGSSPDLNGNIAEIVCYSGNLTTADRARVESYLAAKWGISGVHTPATATSDPVGYWGDKSGNGRHVTTSDASTRPVIHSATHNGRKVLDFDGTNDTLSRDNYTAENDLTGLTRFGVFYIDSGSGAAHLSSVYNGGSYSSFTNASNLLSTHAGLSSSSQHANVGGILTTGTSPRVYCARYDGTAGSFAAGLNIIIDGATLPVASTTGTFPSSLPGGSPTLFIGSNIRANNWFNGKLCEYISYARALTTAERQRVERYLATRWGITLAPQVANADAQDWIDRVYANGGTVSSATAAAVNTFCEAIASAGIRDRFYRMGIFAGSNLNAALVPLYRGPSLGGTQYGNATDTNNAFVGIGTDYAETGASGGLTGNGTSKWLNTGLATNALPSISTGHLSVYAMTGFGGSSIYGLLSTLGPGYAENYSIEANRSTGGLVGLWGQGGTFASLATEAQGAGNGHVVVARTGSTTLAAYRNGSFLRSDSTSVTPTATAGPFYVFGHNPNSTVGQAPLNPALARMGGYSIGASLDATQAAALYTAMQAFQTALTRNV